LLIASDSFVDGLIRAARRQGRYGQRNATLILLMYRHGLRVAEVVRLEWEVVCQMCTFPCSMPC